MDYILFHLKQVTAENPADFHRIQKPEDAENKWKKYVDSVKWSDLIIAPHLNELKMK